MASRLESPPARHNGCSSRQYIYSPLDQDKKSIRLLRVLPALNKQELQCELVNATTAAEYRCLSYCWGEPCSVQYIRLNGYLVSINANLYQFLCEARNRHIEGNLWIDAVCIDQGNLAERNHQVQHMADIYKSARQVLVWLGAQIPHLQVTNEKTLKLHRDFIDRTKSYTEPPENTVPPRHSDSGDDTSGRGKGYAHGNQLQRDPLNQAVHHLGSLLRGSLQSMKRLDEGSKLLLGLRRTNRALYELCKNAYFERVWTISEFVLAQDLQLWWGHDELNVDGITRLVQGEFDQHIKALKTHSYSRRNGTVNVGTEDSPSKEVLKQSLLTLERVHRFVNYRAHSEEGPRPSLIEAILSLSPGECKDERDRAYALLSLASDARRFKVDYDESLEALFLRLLGMKKFMVVDGRALYQGPSEAELLADRLHLNATRMLGWLCDNFLEDFCLWAGQWHLDPKRGMHIWSLERLEPISAFGSKTPSMHDGHKSVHLCRECSTGLHNNQAAGRVLARIGIAEVHQGLEALKHSDDFVYSRRSTIGHLDFGVEQYCAPECRPPVHQRGRRMGHLDISRIQETITRLLKDALDWELGGVRRHFSFNYPDLKSRGVEILLLPKCYNPSCHLSQHDSEIIVLADPPKEETEFAEWFRHQDFEVRKTRYGRQELTGFEPDAWC